VVIRRKTRHNAFDERLLHFDASMARHGSFGCVACPVGLVSAQSASRRPSRPSSAWGCWCCRW
jgi:hypothetical protein